MPLENHLKISLTHKEKKLYKKAYRNWSSQEVPPSFFLSASLTIEAALILPLFLFAAVTVLCFFRVLQTTLLTSGALAAAAARLSVEGEEATMIRAAGYFYGEIWEREASFGVPEGISFSRSSLDGEYIDLQISYRCRLPVSIFGIKDIPIGQRAYLKKWTGCRQETESGTEETRWVYITPNGEVYHRSKDCSYLQLSVETIGKDAAAMTNYTPCLLCGQDTGLYSYYYVTKEGGRYHTRLSCSGLKRAVYMIRLSEASGRTACTRCGG